jgi:hypothetical protein
VARTVLFERKEADMICLIRCRSRRMGPGPLLGAALLLLAAPLACRKTEAPKVETKTETKSTNPDGSRMTTTTETKQIGSTLVSTTETKGTGELGREKSESQTVVGTVTEYGPGKRLVILTGDGEKHSYDLDEKKTAASVDARIAVGSKVRLDQARDESGRRSIRVVPALER